MRLLFWSGSILFTQARPEIFSQIKHFQKFWMTLYIHLFYIDWCWYVAADTSHLPHADEAVRTCRCLVMEFQTPERNRFVCQSTPNLKPRSREMLISDRNLICARALLLFAVQTASRTYKCIYIYLSSCYWHFIIFYLVFFFFFFFFFFVFFSFSSVYYYVHTFVFDVVKLLCHFATWIWAKLSVS